MLRRLAGGRISRFYDRRGPEETLRGRAGMLHLAADWGRRALTSR
jgi:hypothetical protein